jgi:hypothetical protein
MVVEEEEKGEINYKGHKIYYRAKSNNYGDKDTIFYGAGRNAGRHPCFVLSIKDKEAVLQSLERGVDCFVDRHNNSKDLVMVAFQLAKEKGCTKLELTDNSTIQCPPYRFSLADVYFLTTGQTWYESIIPITCKKYNNSKLSNYRQLVKNNKWSDISKYLKSKGTNLDFILTDGIEVNTPGSAMAVLKRIKEMKNDISCRFFSINLGYIIEASNIISLHESSWIYKD